MSSASRGRSASRRAEMEVIDRGTESENSTTSTHPSLGRSYTYLPDDSSGKNANRQLIPSSSYSHQK